jgi:hypothetical protein
MYVLRNIEARLCNHCCSLKAIRIRCSECVFVALGIQYAMRMCRIILSSVACPALRYVAHFISETAGFKKKSH